MAENQVSRLQGQDRNSILNLSAKRHLEKIGKPDWYQMMEQSSQMTGGNIQPYEIWQTVSRESSFNNRAKNPDPKSTSSGLGGFIDKTATSMGITDKTDPYQNIMGVGNYLNLMKQKIGSNDPLEAQKAYLLGDTGYRNMMAGKNPSTMSQIPGLVKKYNEDMKKLSGGEYPELATTTPQQMSGLMSRASNPIEIEEILEEELPQRKAQNRRPMSLIKSTPSELGGIGSLGSLYE